MLDDKQGENKDNMFPRYGQLSMGDISREMNIQTYDTESSTGASSQAALTIRTIKCFEENMNKENRKPASYDITPTSIAISSKYGLLETVYRAKSECSNCYYVYVRPKDTVLVISNEYIIASSNIAGYVTSRVSNVVRGFGHISTTIDPNWHGALLIALSNPSNHSLKIDVGIPTIIDNEILMPLDNRTALATLTFHYLQTPCKNEDKTHRNMRTDLLEKVKYNQRKGVRAYLYKIVHFKRRRFTDYFFDYLDTHKIALSTPEGWEQFLREFSIIVPTEITTEGQYKIHHLKNTSQYKHAFDYIIKENFFRRARHYIYEHIKTLCVIIVIILFTLYRFGLITLDMIRTALQFLGILK